MLGFHFTRSDKVKANVIYFNDKTIHFHTVLLSIKLVVGNIPSSVMVVLCTYKLFAYPPL